MRVLISTSTFPLHLEDGLPRFVYDLAQALARHVEVTALVPHAPGIPDRDQWGDVAIERFRYFWPVGAQRLAYGNGIAGNMEASWLARLQPPGYVLAQMRAIRRLVRVRRIDIVNSHWIVPQGLSAALVRGRPARFRHVVTLHGGDAYLLKRLPMSRWLARMIVERSDAVVAVSSNVREQLDNALGQASGALLQPVGVDVARLRAQSGQPGERAAFPEGYLLFLGRLREIKGVDQLLRALPIVRERHPGLGLVVVGGGEVEAELRAQAVRCSVGDAVRFLGRQPHAAAISWLRGARALVVPSVTRDDGRAEGMPSVVLEAMAAGVRLVATTTGGIPDVVRDRENGWLCRDRDPEDLAAAILRALDAPDEPTSTEAYRTAEAHDWSKVAERYLEIFRSVSRG